MVFIYRHHLTVTLFIFSKFLILSSSGSVYYFSVWVILYEYITYITYICMLLNSNLLFKLFLKLFNHTTKPVMFFFWLRSGIGFKSILHGFLYVRVSVRHKILHGVYPLYQILKKLPETLCIFSRIYDEVSIFRSKYSKNVSKLDHFQIAISRPQIKIKKTSIPP